MPTFPLVSPETFGIANYTWIARGGISRARNAWTNALITQVFDRPMWAAQLVISAKNEAAGPALTAWLAALHRPGTNAGTFLLGAPGRSQPRGSAKDTPGTPVVNGAGQSGEALNVSGLPVSTTGYLLEGDYIQLGTAATSRLHMVLDDVDSDAGGLATINTWPPVRSDNSPANGATVTVSSAKGVFVTPITESQWGVRPPGIYDGVTINAAEVVP